MIMDGVTADNRMVSIGYTEMKKPKLRHVFFMVGVVLVQLTAGFGLYQDVRGDTHGDHNALLHKRAIAETKNA